MHFFGGSHERERGGKGYFLELRRVGLVSTQQNVFPRMRAWMRFTISHDAVGGDARDGAMGHRDGVFDVDGV
jgi:hypothetical protein